MNLDTQLLVGIILIVVGLILALLAYTVLTQPSEEEEQPPAEEGVQPVDVAEAEEVAHEPEPMAAEATVPREAADRPVAAPPPSASETQAAEPEEPPKPAKPAPIPPQEPAEKAGIFEATTPQPGAPQHEPPDTRSFDVATLLRDEVTGKLMVRVGDRLYRSPDELRDSTDWTRFKFAVSDLLNWVPEAEGERHESEFEESPAGPKSMLEQINEILQENLELAGKDQAGIRLIEAADGSVRVLIGVQSYNLDDVPDPEVARFIQEAVSAWEDQQ
jgi:type IV secretory pathway VirB10-like protein